MSDKIGSDRREFLRNTALGIGAATQSLPAQTAGVEKPAPAPPAGPQAEITYPRVFTGDHLAMIAFPLGGVGAGSLSLGGRGQLRDWEIFNRPNKGFSPLYAFPAIWAQSGTGKPVARVLESRVLPPYGGSDGLGASNVPGLSRLDNAKFTGEYPLARIDFEDDVLPVKVSLDAFSPFIPNEADDSGLPVAVLRYTVKNPGAAAAKVSIAFSIDNPVKEPREEWGAAALRTDERQSEFRSEANLAGLLFTNPGMAADHPMQGDFSLGVMDMGDGKLTYWRGWPRGRWWNAPMLYWDDFSADGELGAEPDPRNSVGAVCLQRTIAPGKSAAFTFLLAWRFPNRTPQWCGWSAPKGDEKTVIGNFYAVRFPSSWAAAQYAASHLDGLEKKTREFVAAFRSSTLPAVVKDAASANLSTLASTVCFRTADGEFHGFEGVNDKSGCCHGNCTHVWNYETSTAHLFPSLARSLRKAAFGYSLDDAGAIHFRQSLPDGKERSGFAAADGQMGQIVHTYLDWSLSGDNEWLKQIWPRVKKALEFAWVKGGWDADRDGVMEGVQHNTFDVEFYGPNPLSGIFYLAGLRAGEEMAQAVGDDGAATEYRRLFEQGRTWIDANLFNGEFYIQKVQGYRKDQIAPNLRSDMGADDTEKPEYQMGEGCLADQLLGQYLADVCGLGPLVSPRNARKSLQSIYRYNYKRNLSTHDTVQRTYALNDEAGIVVCDYGKAERPRIPFPYYAEVWTGYEYSTASLMMFQGMVREGIESFRNCRNRFDGKKRNPWDEPECGHHYARAMSAWSGVLALSGFRYQGQTGRVIVMPRIAVRPFRSFWSTATGWGTFTLDGDSLALRVIAGNLPCTSLELPSSKVLTAKLAGKAVPFKIAPEKGSMIVNLAEAQRIEEGGELRLVFGA